MGSNKVAILSASTDKLEVLTVLIVDLKEGVEQILCVTVCSVDDFAETFKSMLEDGNEDCTTLVYSSRLIHAVTMNRLMLFMIPRCFKIVELETYGFNGSNRKCANAYDLFQWLKSTNMCNVILNIYQKLSEKRDELNALDYYYIPKELLPKLCDLPRLFSSLPDVFQNNKIISKYEYCYIHNFNPNARCHFDGPPPIKLHCKRCIKQEERSIKHDEKNDFGIKNLFLS